MPAAASAGGTLSGASAPSGSAASGCRRAASLRPSSAKPSSSPRATRAVGPKKPCSIEYFTRKTPPSAKASAPSHTAQRRMIHASQLSRAAAGATVGGDGWVTGDGSGGGGGGAGALGGGAEAWGALTGGAGLGDGCA